MKIYDKIKNFINEKLDKKWKKISFMFLIIIVLISLISVTTKFNIFNMILSKLLTASHSDSNSVYLHSTDWIDAEELKDLVPGSWSINKRAEWLDAKKARITFEVNTIAKTNDHYKDIIFVLDLSGSMKGKKIEKLQSDASELADYILKDSNNKISIVTFSTSSQIETDFSNEPSKIKETLSNLSVGGGTNYFAALKKVSEIMKSYEKVSNRDLIVMFLSDGYPCEENPNQIAEYQSLKENYPFIEINGVQYEMDNSKVIKQLKDISDNQFIAYMSNLKNILMEATLMPTAFDTFEITDYIQNNYFTLESPEDVKISNGNLYVDIDNQSVNWSMNNNFVSGGKATMTIDVKFIGNSINKENYPTNKGEQINTLLVGKKNEKYYSETPVLKRFYDVKYESNAPTGCNIQTEEIKSYQIFENVNIINDDVPICSGYQFKGWEIVEDDVKKISENSFIMPMHDVTLGGQWTKLELNKSFSGGILKKTNLWKQVQSDYLNTSVNDKGAKLLTELENNDTEYPIYYYNNGRSIESDTNKFYNYVYYAKYCWKIIRTTETGGVKLLYYGTYEEGTCKPGHITDNNGKTISTRYRVGEFNIPRSLAYVGYMYGQTYSSKSKNFQNQKTIVYTKQISNSNEYYYADSIVYNNDSGNYELQNAELLQWGDKRESDIEGRNFKYTCFSSTKTGCSEIYYILATKSGSRYNVAYIKIKGENKTLEDFNIKLKIGTGITKTASGYRLDNYEEVNLVSWYDAYLNNKNDYVNHYMCEDPTKNECSDMHFVTSQSYSGSSTELDIYYAYLNVSINYKYANGVKYENGKYILTDTETSEIKQIWNITELSKSTLHYTCFNEIGECENVYFIYDISQKSLLYFTLNLGKTMDDALNEMLGYQDYEPGYYKSQNNKIDINLNDSNVKIEIDKWYENNIKNNDSRNYEDYIENTIYCNNRKMVDLGRYSVNSKIDDLWNNIKFIENTTFKCDQLNDRFTVNDNQYKFTISGGDTLANGNGKLKYPIGLMTLTEAEYLAEGQLFIDNTAYFLGTPYEDYSSSTMYIYLVSKPNTIEGSRPNQFGHLGNSYAINPVISLKNNVEYTIGDGTKTNPYKITN